MKKYAIASSLCFILANAAYAQEAENTEETAEESAMTEQTEAPAAENNSAMMGTAKYTCSNAGLIRRVEVEYSSPNSPTPCAVNYYKDTEAPETTTTLWQAENTEGYCESKASQFVEKLRSWGWDCTEA